MKKYLLFAGDNYYPDGGWDDFLGAFDTPLEAAKALQGHRCDWYQLVDTETFSVMGKDWALIAQIMEKDHVNDLNATKTRILDTVALHMKWDLAKAERWYTEHNPNFGGASPERLVEMGRAHKVFGFIEDAIKESVRE